MKLKDILVWLFVFIIGSLIVSFLISPNSFSYLKNNIGSIVSSDFTSSSIQEKDPMITNCINQMKSCIDISKKKMNHLSVDIIEYEKIYNKESAQEYFMTWANPMQKGTIILYKLDEVNYPILLMATHVEYDGIENPAVAVCGSDYKLLDMTKSGFMC